MQSRTFVIGDIHGAHLALKQVLERCGFRIGIDKLIILGDICDGWPYVRECVEILLTIPEDDIIFVLGNHDEWFVRWLRTGRHPDQWMQGGKGTMASYKRAIDGDVIINPYDLWERAEDGTPIRRLPDFSTDYIPDSHIRFFEKHVLYYKDEQNRLFVHGGFYRFQPLDVQKENNPSVFYWDRELWEDALHWSGLNEPLEFTEEFSEIFIGHTATIYYTKFKKVPNSLVLLPSLDNDCPPMKADIVYNLDTGAGSSGRLTIMDVDTHEYWQSDVVNTFYGEYKPRG